MTRRPASKVTDQAAFRPHIVRILKAEGPLETEDMLLELEMVEPSLFTSLEDGALDRLAAAIAARVG